MSLVQQRFRVVVPATGDRGRDAEAYADLMARQDTRIKLERAAFGAVATLSASSRHEPGPLGPGRYVCEMVLLYAEPGRRLDRSKLVGPCMVDVGGGELVELPAADRKGLTP